MFVFFFKQKTAYEMRISDWSSDVCSSDLSAQCRRLSRSSLESNWRFRAYLDARRASRSKTRGAGMDGRRCPHLYKSFRSGAGTDQARASELSDDPSDPQAEFHRRLSHRKIGSAAGRERVCQYV